MTAPSTEGNTQQQSKEKTKSQKAAIHNTNIFRHFIQGMLSGAKTWISICDLLKENCCVGIKNQNIACVLSSIMISMFSAAHADAVHGLTSPCECSNSALQ